MLIFALDETTCHLDECWLDLRQKKMMCVFCWIKAKNDLLFWSSSTCNQTGRVDERHSDFGRCMTARASFVLAKINNVRLVLKKGSFWYNGMLEKDDGSWEQWLGKKIAGKNFAIMEKKLLKPLWGSDTKLKKDVLYYILWIYKNILYLFIQS